MALQELVATERSSQIRWGPALCGLSWCCNFFSPPLGARRAGDRLGVLPGGAPAPLGAFSGKWAWAGGGLIALKVTFDVDGNRRRKKAGG